LWKNGTWYYGGFKDVLAKNNEVIGNYEGEGEMRYNDGRKYKGGWRQGLMHGKGRFEWPNGKVYEGEYHDDVKMGEGKMTWTDGRIY
jgi:hypothetical protein